MPKNNNYLPSPHFSATPRNYTVRRYSLSSADLVVIANQLKELEYVVTIETHPISSGDVIKVIDTQGTYLRYNYCTIAESPNPITFPEFKSVFGVIYEGSGCQKEFRLQLREKIYPLIEQRVKELQKTLSQS